VLLNVNITNIADDRVQHFLYGANLDVTVSNKTCTIEGILNKMKE
jgi:hypothetical protein